MRLSQIPWLDELLQQRTPPCVSIYQPLHRGAPPAGEDPIRFRNLLKRASESLATKYPDFDAKPLITRIRQAVDTPDFWTGPRDGMAVFAAGDYRRIIETPQPVSEMVVVGESFHIKPLIRVMQGADRYQILCFTQGNVRLFEGSRYGIAPIPLIDTPRSIYEVSGMTRRQEVSSARDVRTASAQAPEEARAVPRPSSLEHFIRAVDKGIWENHSRRSRLPLILFADGQYHPMWQAISRNPFLLDVGVTLDPDNLAEDRIRDEAWLLYQPFYRERIEHLANKYQVARAHSMGSEHLDQVAQAAAAGRVGALMLADDVHIPGHLDPENGQVRQGNSRETSDDVLDDLAEMVLKMDGQVVAVPPDLMPTDAGLAAIYRY